MGKVVGPRFVVLAVAAALVGLLAVGAGSAHAVLQLNSIGSFNQPMFVTSPPGDIHRVFVVERDGTIRVVIDGVPQVTPFLDMQAQVNTDGEGGLLSMAFAPDYAISRRFYVYYTRDAGSCSSGGCPIRVDEFKVSQADPAHAKPESQRKVIKIDHPNFSNHYGGQLQFGPDGLLYIGTGDGGSGGDPDGNAQNFHKLLGKLLRIDPHRSGEQPYTIPADNPFVGIPGKNEIYAYGLRNPWRFSFDHLNGALVIGDVGQGSWEEIDYAPSGTALGANFGWKICEGAHVSGSSTPCPLGPADDYLGPTSEYDHSAPVNGCGVVITGGYVSRDLSVSDTLGKYLYADECVGAIHSINASNGSSDTPTGLTVANGLVSFGEDALCRIYAASGDGTVYRIDSTIVVQTGCAAS